MYHDLKISDLLTGNDLEHIQLSFLQVYDIDLVFLLTAHVLLKLLDALNVP